MDKTVPRRAGERLPPPALEPGAALDPGIAEVVRILRDGGIETFQSCQGGSGHSFPEPTAQFHGGRGEGYRAVAIALAYGLPVRAVRRVWSVDDGELTGPVWEMVFREMIFRDLAD